MKLFKTKDARDAAGMPVNTFDAWCADKIVQPVIGGGSQGNARVFDLMTVLGVTVANALRQQERGCALSYVEKVVSAFAAMTEAELVKGFAKKKTHFVMEHCGKPILAGPDYPDRIDVQAIYKRLTEE